MLLPFMKREVPLKIGIFIITHVHLFNSKWNALCMQFRGTVSVEWTDDFDWWMTHLTRISAEVARSWHRAACQSWCHLLQCPLPSHYPRRPGASTTGKQQVSVHVGIQTDNFIRLKGWRQSVSIIKHWNAFPHKRGQSFTTIYRMTA